MRHVLLILGAAALSGCTSGSNGPSHVQPELMSPRVQTIRDAELEGRVIGAPSAVETQPLGATPAMTGETGNVPSNIYQNKDVLPPEYGAATITSASAESVAADAVAAFGTSGTTGAVPAPPPPAMAPVVTAAAQATASSATGISNEQDFKAVGAQRSIEADAERMAQNRAQYTVTQPEALPVRQGNGGPNIVQYAVSTSNPVGIRAYGRGLRASDKRMGRKCGNFASSDLAQAAFLERGGPKRDPMGLDPDGDGFACLWDPQPFRNAVRG